VARTDYAAPAPFSPARLHACTPARRRTTWPNAAKPTFCSG